MYTNKIAGIFVKHIYRGFSTNKYFCGNYSMHAFEALLVKWYDSCIQLVKNTPRLVLHFL